MLFFGVLVLATPWRSSGLAATTGMARISTARQQTDALFASDKRPVVLFDGVSS